MGILSESYVYIDITPIEYAIIIVSVVAAIGAGVLAWMGVYLRWLWIGLLGAMPLLLGLIGMWLLQAQVEEVIEQFREFVTKDDIRRARERPTRTILWGVLGAVTVVGMAVVCHFSRPQPKRKSMVSATPPPLPGAAPSSSTDWPEIG